jgi:nucleotide-binding universal stress UspA family protein
MSNPNSHVVVCAVDLHKGSALVAARALDLAASARALEVASGTHGEGTAVVHLVCVAEANIAGVRPPEGVEAPELLGISRGKIDEFVAHRRADFEKAHPGVAAPTVEVHLDAGDAAEKIVEHAGRLDADLIVLGTHGRTGLKRLLIGSVAEKVVRLASCPVLVVREKKRDD